MSIFHARVVPPDDSVRFAIEIDDEVRAEPIQHADATALVLAPGTHVLDQRVLSGADPDAYRTFFDGQCAPDGRVVLQQGDLLELHNDFRADRAAVRTIVPFGNPQSHMFEVRLDADPTVWTVGESVRLSMPTASAEEVLAVPRDALILRREGASVFRVNADMTVDKVNVITGLGAGTHSQVMGELQPGDTVVVRGAERLSPGAEVVYDESSPDGGGTAASR